MIHKYQIWGQRTDRPSAMFPLDEQHDNPKMLLLLEEEDKLLDEFEAHTWEEACSIYHVRVGFEPYKPAGKAESCYNGCGALFYPDGSGECPRCGKVC